MIYDLAIIGGGINGVGIALEAATRGLKVVLLEQQDLAAGTSSKSSKLIHGGLRYLEQYAFNLVKESLTEREILLRTAGHLVQPMPFLIPHDPSIRPGWFIRTGLFCYDILNIRTQLPRSTTAQLPNDPDNPIKRSLKTGYQYYDCIVDDARLVISVAKLAKFYGAEILTRTQCTKAEVDADKNWSLHTNKPNPPIIAKTLINATGPWLKITNQETLGYLSISKQIPLKQVKGSHIVVPKLYPQRQAYLLQHRDNRVIFIVPFQEQFTMIGTTDIPFEGDPQTASIDQSEIDYLISIANQYFHRSIKADQVFAAWSGVRGLWDNGSVNLSSITRDCKLDIQLNNPAYPPIVQIYGGKLTTYRSLGEKVINQLASLFPQMTQSKTQKLTLPGGMPYQDFIEFCETLKSQYPLMPNTLLSRLARQFGTNSLDILENSETINDLGIDFGHGLTEKETEYLCNHEFAMSAEDILWRRTKLGLYFQPAEVTALENWLMKRKTSGVGDPVQRSFG